MSQDNKYLDKKYHQAMLYDFYGELLKTNNKQIYEDYILNDLSLSEIAVERGISRQGIHDTIKRTDKRLQEYESKIHLLKKYSNIQKKVNDIQSIIKEVKQSTSNNIDCDKLVEIEEILKDILNET